MLPTIKRAPLRCAALAVANLLVLLLLLTPTTRGPAAGAALRVALDPETGELVPVTGLDKAALARQMHQMLDRSTAGLAEYRLADGGTAIDLAGRFQSLTVATVDSAGILRTDCLTGSGELDRLPDHRPRSSSHDGETE